MKMGDMIEDKTLFIIDVDRTITGPYGCISPCQKVSLSQQIMAVETSNYESFYKYDGFIIQTATLSPCSSLDFPLIHTVYFYLNGGPFDSAKIDEYVSTAAQFFNGKETPPSIADKQIIRVSCFNYLMKLAILCELLKIEGRDIPSE